MAMIAVAVGGGVLVFVMPLFSDERRAAKRVHNVAHQKEVRSTRAHANETANRRKMVQETLKELEAKRKRMSARLTTKALIEQAGMEFSPVAFYIASVIVGLVATGVTMVLAKNFFIAAGVGFVLGVGLPRWALLFTRSRRLAKFIEDFPNALDVIIRGVKSGLPLNDTVRMIAAEAPEPIRSEFREIVDGQAFGLPIGEGIERMYERVPLSEVNFLSIVITIQSQSGGNLAEALANLSNVLRERKKLRNKIQAVSQEAKSSAAIIGALPIVVMLLVYLSTPDYISLLWERQLGHIMLGASAVWMTIGVLVMRKMINFDF